MSGRISRNARRPTGAVLLAIGLTILPMPRASAAVRHAPARPLSGVSTGTRSGGRAVSALCQLGESGAPVGALDIIDFSGGDDAYYTWLNLDSLTCATCGASSYAHMTHAHVALYFPTAPETVAVEVRVVGVVPVSCHYPNYLDPGAIMCGPFRATLDCQEALTVVDFAVPLPPGCVLQQ